MEGFKKFVAKTVATWGAIGAAIITIGATGFINVPEFLEQLFSVGVVNALDIALQAFVVALGAFIELYQIVRAIFVKVPANDATAVKVLSSKEKNAFMFNPFKLSIAA